MELNYSQMMHYLKQLRLSGILTTLEARVRQAEAESWSYAEFLSRLLEDESCRRGQNQLAMRLRRGQVNTTKTLEGFDWNFNPTINRPQALRLANCEWIRAHRNLLICGPTGAGKTHPTYYPSHYPNCR